MHQHIASVQFLRFVAATLVVVFHTTQALNRYLPGSVSSDALYLAGFGESGVHIFFVISGFVMVYTSFKTQNDSFSSVNFLCRRFIRIYPIYIIYAIAYLIFYQLFASGKALTVEQLIGSLLLLPSYSALIIGPGWTLSFEVYFYIWFGAAMALGLSRGLLLITVVFFTSIALRLAAGPVNEVVHVITNPLLIEFLLGALIGYLVVVRAVVGIPLAKALLVLSILGFIAGLMFGYHRVPSVAAWSLPSALLVGGCVFLERNGHIPAMVRSLSFLGDSSYSLYLLHIVLIDAVIFFALHTLGNAPEFALRAGAAGMIAIGLAIATYCICFSAAAYQLIERPVVASLQNLYRLRIADLVRKS